MSFRRAGTQFMADSLVVIFSVSPVKAQSNQSSSKIMSNDAVIMSPASVAQMQFTVSAKGQK
jgi:hypothetical protein